MNKDQLIGEIRALNPTAGDQFLQQFEDEALAQYLGHLKSAIANDLRIHSWVRRPQDRRRLAS
jgi:hypothetical protein